MKASHFYILGLLALTVLLISACAPPATEAELQASATPIAAAILAPSATPQMPAEPSPVVVEEPQDTACVACHSSQEDLQRLAEQPPETVSLSEGSG